jgi:peptide deformylase
MSVLPIYNCYNPVLKKKTEKINEIDESIKKLVKDMFESMYGANGLGLAGNQVGEGKSIVTIDLSKENDYKNPPPPLAMINPEIITFSDEEVEYQEGCLSIPKFYETVTRPAGVEVVYLDLDGKEIKLEAEGLLARVIQHEVDHLNGILFFERLHPLRRALSKNKLKRIQKGLVIPNYPMIDKDGKFVAGVEDDD